MPVRSGALISQGVILGLVPGISALTSKGLTTNSTEAANKDSRDKPENDGAK